MCSIMGYLGKMPKDKFIEGFEKTISRGPDMSKIIDLENGFLGFHRLAIMELTELGMQPFELDNNYLVCNGEIYKFKEMKKELIEKGYKFTCNSDCEILLPLYKEYGVEMFKKLDGEFALIIYDAKTKSLVAGRDPIGIRPLYYGYDKDNKIMFASEPKNLMGLVNKIYPFPPGHYYKDGNFVSYNDLTKVNKVIKDDLDTVCKNIHDKLVSGIEKRLDSDAPIGFLLSGGLDSSLVCAISAKLLNKKIETFSIGMDIDAIDLKYAEKVAKYINSNHHEIIMTKAEIFKSLDYVIKSLATYDITTIRASLGMYLICKYIHENTDVRVILTGEISDELFGYKYTDFAPNAQEFQKEAVKRIKEIHMYDVLRADRCISVNSLEARVPFGDIDFVNYVMSIDPEMKMNKYNMGKFLLRNAFKEDKCLPEDILFRDKAAFSDAVGHSMVDYLKEYANNYYSDLEFEVKAKKYNHARPFTKEALLYREIFEKYYKGQSKMVKDFWMPNKSWDGCNVNDPSARVLSNYGNSGK
ncbi:MAG: asparagine synthase B [Acholeplasmatales bacterium]|nr:asparagine synthase B [Acholeplasmatales bacterium]